MTRIYYFLQRIYTRVLWMPIIGRAARIAVGGIKSLGFSRNRVQTNQALSTYSAAISGLRDHQSHFKTEVDKFSENISTALTSMKDGQESLRGDIERVSEFSSIAISGIKTANTEVNSRLEASIQSQNGKVLNIGDSLSSLKQEVLDLNQTLHQFKEESEVLMNTRLESQNERVEFIRKEIMFEVRYGSNSNGATSAPSIDSKIINQEKFEQQASEGNIRLNIGAGHICKEDYLNVDLRALPNIDIVAPVSAIPLENGTVSEISSAHLLEHFPQEELQRSILPHLYGLLSSGGKFVATVPDFIGMLEDLSANKISFEDFREVTFGLQDYDGDFHYNAFSYEYLKDLLKQAGFKNIKLIESNRPNGKCLELEVEATK